jgi:hypothetical protein
MKPSALRVRDAEASDLSSVRDALSDIFFRRFEVLRISGLFSETECAAAVQQLVQPATFAGANEQLFYKSLKSGQPGMVILGDSISRKSDAYFQHAAAFEAGCERMFGGPGVSRIVDAMTAVAGGRPVERPHNDAGEPYGLATIRMVSPGGDLLLHCGNAFYAWRSYDALRPLLDTTMQFSFFVVLQAPEGGGGLEVFDADYTDPTTPCTPDGGWDTPAIEGGYPSIVLPAVPGQMILFDGGRYFHKVRPVQGGRNRFTIGGFLSLSKGHDRVLHWA